MLTREEAKKIALDAIRASTVDPALDLVILDEFTRTKPYGWVFLCNTRKSSETRNLLDGVGGNGPIIVEHNKRIHRLGSAQAPDDAVAELEAKRGWRP